jgi:RNA polymerase sigma-70 factor (ECF subfamily)
MSDRADRPGGAQAPGEVTRLLLAWQGGDRAALESLIPLVYEELHRIAQRHMRRERPGHTLQPTAIVNETYLKLIGPPVENWQNRVHFFAVASRVMRQILVDHARRRAAQKRWGREAASRIETEVVIAPRGIDLIAVDDALEKLSVLDPEQAQVVEMRFFGGLTVDEAATALHASAAKVNRKWVSARAWLHRELAGSFR